MEFFAAPMSLTARPASPNSHRCLWTLLCLLLSGTVLVRGSTVPEEAWNTAAASEERTGTTVQLQPDLQTEVQTQTAPRQTENPTDSPTPRTTSNYTGQSSCGSRQSKSSTLHCKAFKAFQKQFFIKDSKIVVPFK